MRSRVVVSIVVVALSVGPACRKSRDGAGAATTAGSVADTVGSGDVPTPADLEAYVTGGGRVRLGMTESQVTTALGSTPSRRQDNGEFADVAWDALKGPRPGAALGKFRGDRMYRIEFAPAAQVYPRLDYATADSVTRAEYVRRSVDRTLRMEDIESVTGVPGYRASWAVASGFGVPTTVMSRWVWDVEPGNRFLLVEETDGLVGQPIIRNKR
jgi:hypothetical protein